MKTDFFNTFVEQIKNRLPSDRFAVGMNLGFSSAKVVKLKLGAKGQASLAGFRVVQNQLDMEPALRQIIQELGIKTVNFSLSGQQAIIRYIDFPQMKKEELRQALKFEAQKYIPFAPSEVTIDACILNERLPDGKMKVLLAAVKNELIDQRLKMLRQLGVSVNLVEIDSISLINAFNFNYGDDETVRSKTVALLNIGSTTSNLNILEAAVPALSRDVNFGGNNITQRIADALGVDFKTAEARKTSEHAEEEAAVKSAVETAVAKLAHEVRSSFDYYESRCASSVEKIYISGGASLFPGLVPMLRTDLGMPVEDWDPLKNIPCGDAANAKTIAGQLCVAIGLALRG